MKISMEEINELYRRCGLPTGTINDDVSTARDFPIPNKLVTEIT